MCLYMFSLFFFFNDTATTEIYTLSLHDALPISGHRRRRRTTSSSPLDVPARARTRRPSARPFDEARSTRPHVDRKSTRLNSSHANISYAVFCLKKKKKTDNTQLNTPILIYNSSQ